MLESERGPLLGDRPVPRYIHTHTFVYTHSFVLIRPRHTHVGRQSRFVATKVVDGVGGGSTKARGKRVRWLLGALGRPEASEGRKARC